MARSKIETALYESFVKGDLAKPAKAPVGKMGLNQSIQMRNTADDGGATQLVRALSSLSGDLQQLASKEVDRNAITQTSEAEKKYLSMTADERTQMIQSGALQQFDPVFNAAYSRLYGEDMVRRRRDEVLAKVQTGELKFQDDADGTAAQKMEKYLVDQRKTDLEGHGNNEYLVSGYDSYFNKLRQESFQINTMMRGREKRQASFTLSQSQFLARAKESNASPEVLQAEYKALQDRFVFTDDEMHKMVGEVAQTLARQGKTGELEKLLGTQFSKNQEYGNLGAYLGDNSEILLNTAKATNLKQRREAFEETYTDLRQAAHQGKLGGFLGTRTADPKAVYKWLEGKGGRDLLEPTQIDSLLQMNAHTIERQKAEAERNIQRQQMAQMRASLQNNALTQALQYGRAGVSDQVTVDNNGVTHVMSADTLYKQAALTFNSKLEKLVADKKMSPDQAFKEQLSFYGKGGTNERWADTLKFGVGAAALVVANPNDQGARRTFDTAVQLYGQLKGSQMPWLADNHVSGKERDILNLAVAAQAAGQDPAQVVTRAMNVDNPRNVTSKEVGKVVKDERLLGRATEIANMYANGLGMPIKDAIAKAKEDLTGTYPKLNGVPVAPITRQMPPDKQEAVLSRLVEKSVTPLKNLGVTPADVQLDTFNQASGFYTLRHKNGFAPVLDEKGTPMVITKKQMLEEVGLMEDELIRKNTSKAIPEDRGAGFKLGKPISLESTKTFDLNIPSVAGADTNFNDVAAPNIGVPRNMR